MKKKTLVIGASTKPERYAYKAIRKLRSHGHPVCALSLKPGQVEDVEFTTEPSHFDDIDTVTLYVGPQNQPAYYDYVKSLKPKRVLFNPGTENPEFREMLETAGIEPVEACTLVLLSTDQY
ncbi:MAG: CoA-binding protein [Spirochaetales bacterium]|nr:CoA-binding protein [Spirochaetales bacterium]